jgi:hypothetical protein
MLASWFDRLVKNKMAGVAVSVSGIAISCFLLTFAKLFKGFIFQFVSGVGLLILGTSTVLFVYASSRQVFVSFRTVRSQRQKDDKAKEADCPTPANIAHELLVEDTANISQ